jgi:hypothetical protein
MSVHASGVRKLAIAADHQHATTCGRRPMMLGECVPAALTSGAASIVDALADK